MAYAKPEGTSIFHAARARFTLRGKQVGVATGITWSETITLEPLKVIDNLGVAEHIPVSYECTLTANMFSLSGASLKSLGFFPKYEDILTTQVMDAQILDSVTGQPVVTFKGVKTSASNFSLAAGAVNAEDVTFVVLRVEHADAL